MKKIIPAIVLLLFSLFIISCEEDENLAVEYVVSGKITSSAFNPRGYLLNFFIENKNPLNPSLKNLGDAIVDSVGNFSFKYKTSRSSSNELAFDLFNTIGKRIDFRRDLILASNWHQEFNFSKNAFIEITFNTNNPLEQGDTLFVSGPRELKTFTFPFENGSKYIFEVSNTGSGFSWARERDKLSIFGPNHISLTPTGAPHIDKITINY